MAHLDLQRGTWSAADTLLGSRDSRKIGHNTRLHRVGWATRSIAVEYHSTNIITFDPDGALTVDANGWHTVTTWQRVNALLPSPYGIHSHRVRGHSTPWLYVGGWPVTPFVDGLTLRPDDGTVEYGGVVILTADDITAIRDAAEAAREAADVKRSARYAAQHDAAPDAPSGAFRHRWDCAACTALRSAEYEAQRARLSAEHDRGEHVATRPVFDWLRNADGSADYTPVGSWHDTGAIETYSTCPWSCPQHPRAY